MTQQNSNKKSDKLIWIDLEMTGLDPDKDVILEIATIVTDNSLNTISEGPVIAINQPSFVLSGMDQWNTDHHRKSGLTQRVIDSGISCQAAEQMTLTFLKQHLNPKESPICGNSICQDRRFLYRHMPQLEAFFHYRNLDVSTIKELYSRWHPKRETFKKTNQHLAINDIRESIEELKYYQSCFFT